MRRTRRGKCGSPRSSRRKDPALSYRGPSELDFRIAKQCVKTRNGILNDCRRSLLIDKWLNRLQVLLLVVKGRNPNLFTTAEVHSSQRPRNLIRSKPWYVFREPLINAVARL
jgi:hypothetical protein